MHSYERDRATWQPANVAPAARSGNRETPVQRAGGRHSIAQLLVEDDARAPGLTRNVVVQRWGTQVAFDHTTQEYKDIVAFRGGGAPVHDGQNVATFYYPHPGTKTTLNSNAAGHSEQRIDAALTKKQKAAVDRVHSEYEPCPPICSPLLQAAPYNLAVGNVTYWWGYGGGGESKESGRKAKKVDLGWSKLHEAFLNQTGGVAWGGGASMGGKAGGKTAAYGGF